jgi:hypothetical protein
MTREEALEKYIRGELIDTCGECSGKSGEYHQGVGFVACMKCKGRGLVITPDLRLMCTILDLDLDDMLTKAINRMSSMK